MVNVGIAGIGFMGWIHWLAYRAVEGARVAAICTRDEKKLAGDWRGIQGNFGPPGEQVDLAGVRTYSRLDELLSDGQIDVIDVCLPPHLHADVALKALAAGKHVFCEKPMALMVDDCERMVATADKADKQVLIGHVLPFFPEYARARQLIESGQYGRALGGHFKRIISDPQWLKEFFDPARVGGPLVDLHVHDAHFIRLLFGMPTSVTSQGRLRGAVVEYCNTLFGFADPSLVVSATSGVINQQGRAFTHGFEIHLEKATLQYEFAVVDGKPEMLMRLTTYTADNQVIRPDLGDGDPIRAFEAEIREVVTAVKTNRPSTILSGNLARDAIVICHKQAESVKSARSVAV
jgi:predicted dehydrogenase